MKSFLKHNWYLLAIFIAVISISGYFLLTVGKIQIHQYINQFVGHPFWDKFFYYVTYLGDGFVMPFMLIPIFFYNIRTGIYSTVSFLSATAITSFLKFFFYDDVMRPHHVFQWTIQQKLKYVDMADLNTHNSFPSGHATQAFAILFCLALTSKNTFVKLFFLALAISTALSRVYLSQHWLVDVTIGSIIGTSCSLFYYYIFIGKDRLLKLNRPILKLKKA